MITFRDFPIEDCARQASERIAEVGGYVHQKWTCRHCGSRQTMEDRNIFHKSGRCEACGQVTIIKTCNYLFVVGAGA